MTDRPDKKSIEQLLEMYCDDQLSSVERAAFEQAMANDPGLRAEVELQSKIDSSLRISFDEAQTSGDLNLANTGKLSDTGRRSQWVLRVAAAIMFALSAGIIYRQFSGETDEGTPSIQARTMQGYYDEAVAAGFKPGWVCSGEVFARTFESRFGERLVVGDLPEGVKLSGLGYGHIRSTQTIAVFASVDKAPVLLFVEPGKATGELSPMGPGMYRHERKLGCMLIYEVSRFSTPKILPHLFLEDVQ